MTVSHFGPWANEFWIWDFKWRRSFFVWEENSVLEFQNTFAAVSLQQREDLWTWLFHSSGSYSVKLAYDLLLMRSVEASILSDLEAIAFRFLWQSSTPLKVLVFSWQLMLGRLPTRSNLLPRKVIDSNSALCCVLCDCGLECENHLFVHCTFIGGLWSMIFSWLGVILPPSLETISLFVAFAVAISRNILLKHWIMIWNAVVWCIWEMKNGIVFGDTKVDMVCILDRIKVCYWKWYTAKTQGTFCSFSDWCVDPLKCIERV